MRKYKRNLLRILRAKGTDEGSKGRRRLFVRPPISSVTQTRNFNET